ncbi:MAG: HAMP domain-containing histidine kinase [Hyphomicrobiaceae bacterium]|nr:HAMP domain-containing histidine kinase [Hyphomicrobiaceae bacterium]
MSSTSRRPRRQTVLTRVALALAVVSGVTAALFGVGVYLAVKETLTERARTQISGEVERILRLGDPLEIGAEVRARVRQARELGDFRFLYRFVRLDRVVPANGQADSARADFVQACPEDGEDALGGCPFWSAITWPDKQASGEGWERVDLSLPSGLPVRVLWLARNVGARHQLLVARPEFDEEPILNTVAGFMAATTAIVMLAAGVLGWFASSRLVERIERLNEACAAIGGKGVSGRVPDVGENDEFSDLSGNINAMLDRIAILMEALEHLSDQVAHDLRTPLGRMRSRLEGVVDRLDTHGPIDVAADRSALLAPIEATIDDIDQTLRTFEALLRIARIETGAKKPLVPVDLADIAREIIEIYEPVAEIRGQALSSVLSECAVAGDGELLRQMLTNLVDNALKYSSDFGKVEMRLETTRRGFTLKVSDDGPGIPENEREKVFERYFRGSGENRAQGTGLGLSFVRAVTRRHGFAIALSDAAPGLCVSVSGERIPGDEHYEEKQSLAAG